MPKQRITREMVVDAAFSLARREGPEQMLVKRIAEELHCSVQPIYSYLSNMEELRKAVAEKAAEHMQQFMAQNINPADPFRSTGYAYVRYAKEEPHLFRLFIGRKREYMHSMEDLYGRDADPRVPQTIARTLNISMEKAKELHLSMLIFTTGVGTMLTTGAEDLSESEMQKWLENAYQAFLNMALK